jgi:hypothetical protein
MTLLGKALQIRGVEEELRVAAVRHLVIHHISLDRPAGVEPAFAQWLLAELRVS